MLGPNIAIACENCFMSDAEVIRETWRLQNAAFNCTYDYLGHLPNANPNMHSTRVTYYLLPYLREGYNGIAQGQDVSMRGCIGVRAEGARRAMRPEDVRMEFHELAHVFTNAALERGSSVPDWFEEGFSIQTENRISCSSRQIVFNSMAYAGTNWRRLKLGRSLYREELSSPHTKGMIFFAALESDYGCGFDCSQHIWNDLQTKRNTAGL